MRRRTTSGSLKVTTYHGQKRVQHHSEFVNVDVVLTTFGTVAAEYRKPRQVLFYVRWFRIFLDEGNRRHIPPVLAVTTELICVAHTIRSRRTKQFEAVMTLQGRHHWCLTGTPISNKVDDLGALISFCRVPLLEDRRCFQIYVTKVANKNFRNGCKALRQTLTPICLRRTRAILNIPEPNIRRRDITFSSAERSEYTALMRHTRIALDEAVSGKATREKRHTILHAIQRLQILCNVGTFAPRTAAFEEASFDADEALTLLQSQDAASCTKCTVTVPMINQLQTSASGVLGRCSHLLCAACYESIREQPTAAEGSYTCPCCMEVTAARDLVGQLDATVATGALLKNVSSKLNALVDDLAANHGQDKR